MLVQVSRCTATYEVGHTFQRSGLFSKKYGQEIVFRYGEVKTSPHGTKETVADDTALDVTVLGCVSENGFTALTLCTASAVFQQSRNRLFELMTSG